MNEIVITTGPLGGVGDHLLYSTLPERYTNLGFKVYLDQDNIMRNDEAFDLIWSRNPFILGTSDRKPNAGYINQGKYYDVANRFPIGSIEAMERAHGFLPPYGIAPKLYYKPEPFRMDLRGSILVDFTAISSRIEVDGLKAFLFKMQERFGGRQMLNLLFPEGVTNPQAEITGASLRLNNIFEYVDALSSCYGWIGTEAGGQSLAAAVRGEHDVYAMDKSPECVCIILPKTYNSRGYTYRGVDYRVTTFGSYSGDYWDPAEVGYERYQMQCRSHVLEEREKWRGLHPDWKDLHAKK